MTSGLFEGMRLYKSPDAALDQRPAIGQANYQRDGANPDDVTATGRDSASGSGRGEVGQSHATKHRLQGDRVGTNALESVFRRCEASNP